MTPYVMLLVAMRTALQTAKSFVLGAGESIPVDHVFERRQCSAICHEAECAIEQLRFVQQAAKLLAGPMRAHMHVPRADHNNYLLSDHAVLVHWDGTDCEDGCNDRPNSYLAWLYKAGVPISVIHTEAIRLRRENW